MRKLMRLVSTVALLMVGLPTHAQRGATVTYFVSPEGNDLWNGTLSEPNEAGSDGPFRTITRAREAIRNRKDAGEEDVPVSVKIRGGIYNITEAIVFTPEDSGAPGAVITYEAYPEEQPTISGGRRITAWAQDGDLWTVEIPDLRSGKWSFDSLWVNGQRCIPARIPNTGQYMSDGYVNDPHDPESTSLNALRYTAGDLTRFEDLEDIRVVLTTVWEASIHYVESWDAANRIITFTAPAWLVYGQHASGAPYFIENAREGLDQPGEWQVDRSEGKIHYYPRENETIDTAEFIAATTSALIELQGNPAQGRFVEHLAFEGLRFLYAENTLPRTGYSSPQAATTVGAAIEGRGVRYCSIEGCEIARTGTHGIWFREGSRRNRLRRNHLHDLGGGGIYLGGTGNPPSEDQRTVWNEVDNNWLHGGGRVFPSGCGIWIGAAAYNTVSHNEVFDFFYTGISVGWSWGYGPSAAHHNSIEYNHVHRIGQRRLSDMGGIYTLGVSPGTVLRGNYIHDIEAIDYGAHGIYTDEGSTDIRIENNVVHDAQDGAFHQHYGKDNVIVNNIFAFARSPVILRSRVEDLNSFFIERNIVVSNNGRILGRNWGDNRFKREDNCYWDAAGNDVNLAGLTLEEWRAKGQDLRSIIADPLFFNAKQRDFRLHPESPAFALGFEPIAVERAGLYGDPAWVKAAADLAAATAPLPPIDPDEEVFENLWSSFDPVMNLPETALFKTDPERIGDEMGWFKPELDTSDWRPIRIGLNWEEQIGQNYDGIAWYRSEFSIPAELEGRELVLSFGAVDERAVVYVNGKLAGEFGVVGETWNTRFEIDITPYARPGEPNALVVAVEDELGVGGLWRPIKLITPKTDMDSGFL